MAHSSERERDRKSLKDLARLASSPSLPSGTRPRASAPSDSGVHEDSGLIDLKALSQTDVNAVDRASVTPLASSGLFEDEPLSSPLAPSSASSARATGLAPASEPSSAQSSVIPPSGVAPRGSHVERAAPLFASSSSGGRAERKPGGVSMLAYGVVALATLAAGAFFVLRDRPAAEPILVVATQGPATAAQVAPAGAAAVTPPTVVVTKGTAEPSGAVDPSALPIAKVETPAPPPRGAHAATPAAPVPQRAPAAAPAPQQLVASNGPRVDPKLVARDLPPSPGTTSALGDAMKQAAGPVGASDPSASAAPGSAVEPGSVSQKPSQGAVTGALGAALPGARACLGPDDPVSRAQVVFGSDGAVQAVNVSGAAAGKPAEACIKAALGKAKVPPFAQPSYPAWVNVRPN